MSDCQDYAFLGWHGWGFEHPAAWELNRVKGSRQASYLTLDDGERIRLEVNWKPVKRTVEMEALADRQAKMLAGAAKRRRLEIEIERQRRIGRVRGFEYEAFTWKADVAACELVARCKDCGRVMLLRVIGDAERPPMDEARHIFSTLECYCGKDYERWGTFGLDVNIPFRFDLERSSLKAGLCELVFSDRRVELHISRASMGRAILEERKMVAWYEDIAEKFLKPFYVEWRAEEFRGHVGHAGTGELRSNRRLLGFFRSNRGLFVHCFFCESSDKIYVVAADGAGDVREAVETVREGLVCHG